MVDPERVERRLRELDFRLASLRELAAGGKERFRTEAAVRTQVERHLQIAVQAAIDIAVHILAEDSTRSPEDYGSAFIELGALGIVDEALAHELRLAAGLRNILVHAYLDVDPDQLWAHLESLDRLETFAAAIASYIRR